MMTKVWAIAKTTYQRRIWTGTFLILTFGLPILMVIAAGIPIIQQLGGEVGTIGVVDKSGELAAISGLPVGGVQIEISYFTEAETADEAWQAGNVVGYLVVPEDYLENHHVQYFSDQAPPARVEAALTSVLRRGLVPDQPEAFYQRLDNPASMEYLNLSRTRQLSEGLELILKVATPVAFGLMFALTAMTGASQIGQAIAEEKDQRSMEMIITSVSPRQLIAGKLAGMTLLTLTQVMIWILSAGLVLLLAFGDEFATGEVMLPWQAFIWAVLLAVPGYLLFAVLAAGLGVIAGDRQQAQQLAGMLGFLGLFPVWFMGPVVQSPSGPVAIGLTLFPLTSPIVGLFRLGISEVPVWQLLAGSAGIFISIGLGLLVVARVFRAGMLMYGQRLSARQVLRALRQA